MERYFNVMTASADAFARLDPFWWHMMRPLCKW